MPHRLHFGNVDVPEGLLVIVDHGLAHHWWRETRGTDLEIVGKDAARAGRAYDREFDPLFLFDREDPEEARRHFDAFANEQAFDARAQELAVRVPRAQRVRSAVEAGDGLGVVKYDGLWGIAVGGLPIDRGVEVFAEVMPDGEFGGRLRRIVLDVNPRLEVATTDEVAGIMVDHGQFLFAGLGAMQQFDAGKSRDGLADYVFWGRDAAALTEGTDARALANDEFGWVDIPDDEVGPRARAIQDRIENEGLAAGVDYRPHCNRELANSRIRESEIAATEIEVAGSRVVACDNRWGDGLFEVSRDRDANGNLVRIRLELATEKRLQLMRSIAIRYSGAIVSRAVLDDGEPINIAERSETERDNDSGWYFGTGRESDEFLGDAKNFAICRVDTILRICPELEPILLAEPGSFFIRAGDRFVQSED